MKKFKLKKNKIQGFNTCKNESKENANYHIIEIECEYVIIDNFITIDELNLERANTFSNHKIGDVVPLMPKSISFLSDGFIIDKYSLICDNEYELYEFINNIWVLIDSYGISVKRFTDYHF